MLPIVLRVSFFGFHFWGFELRVQGSGFRIWGPSPRNIGLGVQASGSGTPGRSGGRTRPKAPTGPAHRAFERRNNAFFYHTNLITRNLDGFNKLNALENGSSSRCKTTRKRGFKLPWRKASPPNHLNDKVDPDQ